MNLRRGFVPAAAMQIGDLVIWNGCAYIFRGLEPMSIPDRRAELEDPASGERRRVRFDEVSEHVAGEAFHRDP